MASWALYCVLIGTDSARLFVCMRTRRQQSDKSSSNNNMDRHKQTRLVHLIELPQDLRLENAISV